MGYNLGLVHGDAGLGLGHKIGTGRRVKPGVY